MTVQLRIRTEYSFGQTYAPMERIMERLKQLNVTHAAIVDRSSWGHHPWARACKKHGITPMFGMEIVVSEDDDSPTAMWFVAKTTEGLSELYAATTKGYKTPTSRGFPMITRADVEAMSDDIFKFAGHITDGPWLKSINAILDLDPSSQMANVRKRRIAEEHGLHLVNVSDNAYSFEEDLSMFEVGVRGGKKPTPQYILDIGGLDELEIAVQCEGVELRVAPMLRADGDIEAMCREGIARRALEWTAEYEERLRREIDVIKEKDFDSYFIIVSDMVKYAKTKMLVGPSRGSAAGSLTCYLLGITEVDPIPPGLFFERFIDLNRSDLPDIDLDFPDHKRHLVIEYMAEKYGSSSVAQLGTIIQYRPKSALVQVCKSLNIPHLATWAVKNAMIERSSADSRATDCLEDTFRTTEPGKQFIEQYPEAMAACGLEGHASHTGKHAAGLMVAPDDITNYAVVDGNGVAHIDKINAEQAGLLKIDVLGLRTLTILEDAGVDIDWYRLPFDDKQTLDVFNKQRLCSIFQFEGEAMRAISKRISFGSIVDIDAVTALARPGPFGSGVTENYIKRRNGEQYASLHPLVEQQMKETYGLPVYQEQTLAIVRNIGMFSWKETSTIRKAMSKRMGKEFFDTHWETFKVGAAEQGIPEKDARAIWESINSMGAWQMNKAHTYSYAIISYWCAYLKAHHPIEFAAANLRHAKDDDHALMLLREMVKEGVKFVPLDLDKSVENWSAHDGVLYGGFQVLHGVGESKAKKYVEMRDAGLLTDEHRKKLASAKNPFQDLFPLTTKYQYIFDDPEANGVTRRLLRIDEIHGNKIPHRQEIVFIGELISKNARDANEEVNVKKRGGKRETGPTDYCDFKIKDDYGTLGCRINRFDFDKIGRALLQEVPIGAHLMVRAAFYNNIKYGFVCRWKVLSDETT